MNKEQLQERLTQCKKDIATIEIEKIKLEKEIKKATLPKFGDVVKFSGWLSSKRIILYDEDGNLKAFARDGVSVGSYLEDYIPTGKNIFDEFKLDI